MTPSHSQAGGSVHYRHLAVPVPYNGNQNCVVALSDIARVTLIMKKGPGRYTGPGLSPEDALRVCENAAVNIHY
jgi:hypothetical protein